MDHERASMAADVVPWGFIVYAEQVVTTARKCPGNGCELIAFWRREWENAVVD
jgi:hypothetical protein